MTSGPGGGTDNFARTVQSIIAKHKLMDAPIVVTNKGGGSGAEGFVYAAGYKGDPYKLTFGTNNEYLLPSVAPSSLRSGRPDARSRFALDEFLVWVNGESKFNDIKPILWRQAKAEPKAIQFGGSQSKDTDQILFSTDSEAAGAEFRYIPFKSGGEAAVQLAGGHIDANVNNPNENRGQWQAGMVKPLCVFRPDRFPEASARCMTARAGTISRPAPRLVLPIDSYRMPRTVWLPAGVDEDVVAFYRDVLKKVSETPEWADYVAKTSQSSQFTWRAMTSDAYQTGDRVNVARFLSEKAGWRSEPFTGAPPLALSNASQRLPGGRAWPSSEERIVSRNTMEIVTAVLTAGAGLAVCYGSWPRPASAGARWDRRQVISPSILVVLIILGSVVTLAAQR